MCDGIANGGPRYYAPAGSGGSCPPANVIISSNLLDTNGNVIAGNVISRDGTFTGNLYVAGQVYGNIIYNSINIGGVINTSCIFASAYFGNGYGLSNLNAGNLTGVISVTNLPPSGAEAGVYGDYSNVSRINIDEYGRVTAAANVAILSSQWTTVAGNVAYTNGVSIGTFNAPPPGSNLLVLGTANIDTINVNTLFANSATVFGSQTLNVLGISNLFFVSGDGGGMSNIRGSSVSGNVANANVALVVSQPAQPNITSVGVLTSLTIIGSISAGTISGSGQGIYDIPGSAIKDTVSTANSIVLASQPNITSVGTLTGLEIQGLLVASNASGISNINASNISLGTLSPSILPASGVTSGLYGSGANVSSVTVDTYGRVVSASNIAITASQWTGAIGGPLYYQNFVGVGSTATPTATMQVDGNVYASNAITTPNIFFSNKIQDVNLPESGVTSGEYGSSANIPTLVVDTYGRIVSGSNTSVIGSQWTSVGANVAFGNGVSIGTLSDPPTGSNLYVIGLATISNIAANGAALSAIQASNIVGNVATANVALVVSQPAQPNITSLGTLTGLYSSGNITGTFFTGGGNALSNIQSSVLVGNVATANVALVVSQAAQPNITSVGTTATVFTVNGLLIAGNASGLSNINSSNLVGNVANTNVALVVSQPAQPNITSLGTLTGIYATGNLTATFFSGGGNALSNIQSSALVGNVANANVALVVSQAAQPNITSVGTTATLFTVNGLLIAGNASGLSNINSSNLVGNVANANVALVVSQPAQPNITSLGTLTGLYSSGNITGTFFTGGGNALSNIQSSVLVGNVANANVALVVSQAAQPNITSVSTAGKTFTVNGLLIAGNASGLSNINSSNLVGNVANTNVALVVSQPAQPNITSVGTTATVFTVNGLLIAANASGLSNINSSNLVGNVANANVALVVSQPAQPNITSVGTTATLFTVNGLLIAANASGLSNINSSNLVGNVANANVALVVSQAAQPNITSLGTLTGLYSSGNITGTFFTGGGNALSNIQSSVLVGNVANANVALVVSQPAQPNITSVSTAGKTFTINGLLIAGNASGLSNINSSNLVGNVANANVALVVSQPAQPNITSLGTLTGIYATGNLTATFFSGGGNALSNIQSSALVGNVANANVALVVSQPAQPNITSVSTAGKTFTVNGLLIAANASGLSNINSSNLVGNVANANVALVVSQASQPNITSVGTTATVFTVNGLLIAANASGLSNINSSNLVGNVANANVALVVSQAAQPNITSLGTLTGIYATGNLTATFFSGGGNALSNIQSSALVGNVANANVALVVSQPAQPNITSVSTAGKTFTINGLLIAGNASGLSNINSSNLVGNVANTNVALVVSQPAQPNITSLGTLTGIYATGNLTATFFSGGGNALSNIQSSSLVGNVANANVALVVSQPAQPNITSVGTTATVFTVNGLLIAANASGLSNINSSNLVGNVANANVALVVSQPAQPNITSVSTAGKTFTINGLLIAANASGLSNINSSNLVGNVANANVALVVSQPAQPNITSVGTTATLFTVNGLLIAANASGLSNINSSNLVGNVANANVALVVSQPAQPNITSVGTLSNLVVSNSVTTSNLVSKLINIFTTSNLANVVTNDLTVPGSMRANLTNTTFFFNTLTIPFISATTLNVSSTSNLDTLTLSGEPGITTLYAVGNIFSTNSFSTTNVFATTANIPTIFASNSLTTGNVFVSNGLDVGPGTLGTNVVIFSNISGGANAFVMDSNGRVTIGSTYSGGSLLSFGQASARNKIITLYDGNNADNPVTATNFSGFGINGNILRYQVADTATRHVFYGGTSEYARITGTGVSILTGAAPTANLHVAGNVYASNALSTTNVLTSNINVTYTANIANLVVTSNILAGPSGSTYLTGNLVVSGNVFTSLGTPLGEGGSLYYSLASNYKPPVYTGVLYGQALALSLTPFNEQGSSTLVYRSANGNFRFNKPGIYNIKAVFLTTQDNIIGMGIGSNVSDTTTRTDQTYVYSYTTFITKNPTETLDIQFYVGSTTAYYYIDIYAIDSPTLMPTSDPIGGSWLSIGPFQGGGGSGPPVTISTLGAVVTGRTTSYGAGVGDYYIGMSNGQTVNLPIGSTLSAGKQYIIKDESGKAGILIGYRVTIASSSPDLIDGEASVILALNYGAINVLWTGSFWSIF